MLFMSGSALVLVTDNGRHDAFLLLFCKKNTCLLLKLSRFGFQSEFSRIHVLKLIFNYMSFKSEFQIRNLWAKFFWHIALSYKVCFLLMISGVASLRVKIFSDRLDFYTVMFVVYYWFLRTLEHLQILFSFLNTWNRTLSFCVFGLVR